MWKFFSSTGAEKVTSGTVTYELSHVEKTTNVSTAVTTQGTAVDIVVAASITLDGSTPVFVEFLTPNSSTNTGTASNFVSLWDNATPIGVSSMQMSAASNNSPQYVARRLTPSAGAHVFKATLHVSAGTGIVSGDPGGSGQFVPMFIRVTRAN